MRSARARKQPGADLRQPLGRVAAGLEHVRAVLEVALGGGAEVGDGGLGELFAEHLAQLVDGPDVELALDPLGVGVERRAEAALRPAHLAQRPVERLDADLGKALLARHLPGVQVGAGQERVVVEHLLEVRHRPGRVDRVAREAAANLVVDAARGHRVQRRRGQLDIAGRQQELERAVGREFRGAAPAAVNAIEHLARARAPLR